jgi:hypothetical protein
VAGCAIWNSLDLEEANHGLIEGIAELVVEYKGVKVSLKKALDKVAKEYSRVEEKARKAIEIAATTKAGGGISVTAAPTVRSALGAKAQALRDSMGRDLEHLEKLSNVTATAPVAAMIESWAILKKNVVETAKLHGFELSGGSSSEVKQALFYLTTRVLDSQDVMIGVYSLATAMQKVEQKPDAEVSVRDAQDFVRYCMAIVADLSFDVDKLIESETKD